MGLVPWQRHLMQPESNKGQAWIHLNRWYPPALIELAGDLRSPPCHARWAIEVNRVHRLSRMCLP
jgi:hypothetical protein